MCPFAKKVRAFATGFFQLLHRWCEKHRVYCKRRAAQNICKRWIAADLQPNGFSKKKKPKTARGEVFLAEKICRCDWLILWPLDVVASIFSFGDEKSWLASNLLNCFLFFFFSLQRQSVISCKDALSIKTGEETTLLMLINFFFPFKELREKSTL